MLFCSVWTLLAVAYLVLSPTYYAAAAHKYAICAVEAVTMIFWFAAWVAVAALWGDIGCGSRGGVCGAGTAAIVFGAIIWYIELCPHHIEHRLISNQAHFRRHNCHGSPTYSQDTA